MPDTRESFPLDNGGKLKPTGEWRRKFNLKAWANEVKAVEKELKDIRKDSEDMDHLMTIINAGNAFWLVGCISAPFCIYFSAFCLSTAVMARWTMVGHHVLHGGYSKNQGRYHRWTFAKGFFNRLFDWLDWMLPEAWNIEHNKLHHYKLGEEGDPDLVERNLEFIRQQRRNGASGAFCYFQIAMSAATWKWFYYAPNVLKEQEKSEMETRGSKKLIWSHLNTEPATFLEIAKGVTKGKMDMAIDITRVLAPYFFMMFIVIPLASYMTLGHWQTALQSVVLAEILTNLHSFCIIVSNHAGRDIYKFDTSVVARSDEFYLRAVIGSTNFHTGSDFGKPGSFVANCVDFVHGWLNYQIEHHMFPDMSMLQYQKAAPRIREICLKHGVPYVQEPVWTRVIKTARIMAGDDNMLHWESGQ